MLESVIDARDRFLDIRSDEDDFSGDQTESIVIFPSHAYLVGFELTKKNVFVCLFSFSIVLRSLTITFESNRIECGKIISIWI